MAGYPRFSFYDWVTFRSEAGFGQPRIGRWLDVSHKIGQAMSYWVLPDTCKPISCQTVQRVTRHEMGTDEFKKMMRDFDQKLAKKIQDVNESIIAHNVPVWNRLSINELFMNIINDTGVPDEDESQIDFDTNYAHISMEIGLPRGPGGNIQRAVVKRRAIGEDGMSLGVASSNPLENTRLYEVEFVGGDKELLSANVITENLLSQIDHEGHRQLMLSEIIDHRRSQDAVHQKDAYIKSHNNNIRQRCTTKGWELCVEWTDGSTNWISLKDMKNLYPLEVADYAIANDIDHESAYVWWVPYVIKKRRSTISKSKYWEKSHKYGIKIPKTYQEAIELDRENNNTLWRMP